MLKFDPENCTAMMSLMDKYGNSDNMLFGDNDQGENVTLSIYCDKIICTTYQKNGWARTDIYYRDGDREETYNKY